MIENYSISMTTLTEVFEKVGYKKQKFTQPEESSIVTNNLLSIEKQQSDRKKKL